jgi:RNA polymerase sigma-70 factor (ECF subfamily)
VDHVRSRQSAASRELAWIAANAASSAEDERAICRCFEALIPTLKPKHAALLRLVEIDEQPVASAATALGITANAASVTLHRARRELRVKLEQFCRDCAKASCLDCDCAPAN